MDRSEASRMARVRSVSTPRLARAGEILLLAGLYYMAARFSLRLSLIHRNVTPLWPPTGIAVVAFLLLGRRAWPGIAVAAFLVNDPISASAWAAALTAVGNTLAPAVAAELLVRAGFRNELDRVRDVVALVFLAALASMLISATVGAGTLVLSGVIQSRGFLSAWAVWWTGDAMGVLVVAPFLLSLLYLGRGLPSSWARRAEACALFLLLTVLSLTVMRSEFGLLFVLLPFVGWAAWRFQQRGAAPAALLVAGIGTWAAAHGWAPFATGTLFGKMLTLQAFNASVAFTSLVLAAMVTERMRAKEQLEHAAAQLEERVRRRTSELSLANEQLRQEVAQRKQAQRTLQHRGRQLAEAQQVARIGSWEWVIPEDRVTWSDEMYRIHGYAPQEFPVTFDKAVEQVVPEDLDRIQLNLAEVMATGRSGELAPNEYRIVRVDGAERVLVGKARLTVDQDRQPVRMVGTVQDVTDERQAEREHRIAETLQRSLLPEKLPEIAGVSLAARYVPATADLEVGGDWYDVVQLPNGDVGVAIGDVAGHGLRAATTMGQLRMGLRAYAVEETSPARLAARAHGLVQRLQLPEMATLLYLVYDLDAGTVTFANAGHPPPLVVPADGEARYITDSLAPPLGAAPDPALYTESVFSLPAGSTLLLFTDGLVERRGASLDEGLERLKALVPAGGDLDVLCDELLERMLGPDVSDDVAILALRPTPAAASLHLRVPAEPRALGPMRHTVRRWLRERDASSQEVLEILVACGEACANAVQHAYGAGEGSLEITLHMQGDEIEIVVRDFGRWREPSGTGGGRGLLIMRGFMDAVDVEREWAGTTVRMARKLRTRVS